VRTILEHPSFPKKPMTKQKQLKNPIIIQKAKEGNETRKRPKEKRSVCCKALSCKSKYILYIYGLTLRASESGEQCDDGSASSSCGGRRRNRGGLRRLPRHTPCPLSITTTAPPQVPQVSHHSITYSKTANKQRKTRILGCILRKCDFGGHTAYCSGKSNTRTKRKKKKKKKKPNEQLFHLGEKRNG
jgi:hypothetical protein